MIRPIENTDSTPPRAVPSRTWLRELLHRDGGVMLAAALATLAVQWGVFLAGRWGGVGFRESVIAMLAVSSLWMALIPPCLAAGGLNNLSGLLRGGIVADTTGVSLLALWAVGRAEGAQYGISLLSAVKVYCVYTSLCLAGIAAGCLARRPAARAALAVAAGVVFVAVLASPLWISAWVGGPGEPGNSTLVTWAVRINPFYAISDAVVGEMRFIWDGEGLMYGWSRIGEYAIPSPVGWYETCLLYLAVAGCLAIVPAVRRRSSTGAPVNRHL